MADFQNVSTSTVQLKVPLNADGNIATKSETTAGVKTVSIDGIKATATLTESNAVFNAFYGVICNSSFDSLTAKKITTQGVV